MASGKSTLQPPPKPPRFAIKLRIVIDELADGSLLTYVTSPVEHVNEQISQITRILNITKEALLDGHFTMHAVGTEAEAMEIVVK